MPEARDQLTAQELQIAQLAAQGLSNREIGQRLFLSHRTISTHLYRVFPKLGITSRAELSAALAPVAMEPVRSTAKRGPRTTACVLTYETARKCRHLTHASGAGAATVADDQASTSSEADR